ncbi:hypothetical protein Purlil1_2102 [Purpureocillium lilacinum]|uniref:VOC domain-containing protein n=1 Tax=Purpureocillium lilacinum TaxID=33203 RepID=A0ABR0CDI4_PURLI|nr:hypothetical protein Purlil1_2102 [Purpureocillium lilacinum]
MPGHVSIRVLDLEASVRFYLAALAPLRYEATRFDGVVGLGPAPAPSTSSAASGTTTTSTAAGPIPDFWLRQYTPGPQNGHAARPTPVHVSFYAGEAALVDEFHAEGVRAGGSDNGGPGERPWFKGYYAAYVLDPDGNNIEVQAPFSQSYEGIARGRLRGLVVAEVVADAITMLQET